MCSVISFFKHTTANSLLCNIFSLSCLVVEFSEAVAVQRPRAAAVSFVGDTTVLHCRTNNSQNFSLKWVHGLSVKKEVASSVSGVNDKYPRVSLNRTTEGQFDLLINRTQSSDADRYSCLVGFNVATEIDLTLLG